MEAVDRDQLDAWLARLDGPDCIGPDDQKQAVAEMRAVGADVLFPLLIPMLTGDEETWGADETTDSPDA